MLSSITTHFDIPTNKLYALRNQLVARGDRLIDLISGNVNLQGIHFPSGLLSKAISNGLLKTKVYQPHPLGQESARLAISRYYAREGLAIPSEQVVITPGTSVSYWYAFKVLADAGDEILCPTPSYPLFDSIAGLCGIKLVPYRLEENRRWQINAEHLESSITPRTKAIVLISPHNPTGAVASEENIDQLANLAIRKRLAIISDEVFSPFLFRLKSLPRPAATKAPLILTLNGFSKMLALPGIKIGWMAVSGDPTWVHKAIKALDMISDTFLPVNEMAQAAVPALLSQSGRFQSEYVATLRERKELAVNLLKKCPGISLIEPEGGFFLTMRLKEKSADEEDLALRLLKEHRLLVHPGYFYDMEGQHLVMSIVNKPSVLRKAIQNLKKIIR